MKGLFCVACFGLGKPVVCCCAVFVFLVLLAAFFLFFVFLFGQVFLGPVVCVLLLLD